MTSDARMPHKAPQRPKHVQEDKDDRSNKAPTFDTLALSCQYGRCDLEIGWLKEPPLF